MFYFLKYQLARGRSGRSAVVVDTPSLPPNFHQSRSNVSAFGACFTFEELYLDFTPQAVAHSSGRGGKRGKTRGEDRGGREGS